MTEPTKPHKQSLLRRLRDCANEIVSGVVSRDGTRNAARAVTQSCAAIAAGSFFYGGYVLTDGGISPSADAVIKTGIAAASAAGTSGAVIVFSALAARTVAKHSMAITRPLARKIGAVLPLAVAICTGVGTGYYKYQNSMAELTPPSAPAAQTPVQPRPYLGQRRVLSRSRDF